MTHSHTDYGRDFCLQRVRDMLRVRRMEERCAELYGQGLIRGFLHLYIGEEAVAAGVMPNLNKDDAVVATYREHAHALLRGVSMRSIMAEMFGKQEGCSHGRGGSMHLFDAETRFYGGNAIVGGGLPIAAGLALADQMQKRHRVTVCFFGEGAVAEGVFHESMNLAALWQLPVLFCCENNLYAMGTALSRSESQTDLMIKVASYGMAGAKVDGMDVIAVHEAAVRALASIRERGEPYFLECQTYRFRAHSMFDPELYREKTEVEEWKKRGPIHSFTDRLKQTGLMTEEDFAALEEVVRVEVDDAVSFAHAATWEPVEELTRHLYGHPEPNEG